MSDPLSTLFLSFNTKADVNKIVADSLEETIHLEFKEKSDPVNDEWNKSDKLNFAKCLSGFANADGGVLIWGIQTRNPNKLDKATGLAPLSKLDKNVIKLRDFCGEFTQPSVSQIQIVPIYKNRKQQIGYIKCLIPKSDRAPHRATHELRNRENQYWRRDSYGFRVMDHYELEDMFGRRPRPDLALLFSIESIVESDGSSAYKLIPKLTNNGASIAKYYGFQISFDNARILRVDKLNDDSSLNNGLPIVSYQSTIGVIHPNGNAHVIGSIDLVKSQASKPINASIKIYCENMMVKQIDGSIAQ